MRCPKTKNQPNQPNYLFFRSSTETNFSDPNLIREPLISIRDAAASFPSIGGRKQATSTVYRWCRHGINGIRLEYVRVGRSMATSRNALDRFLRRLAFRGAGSTERHR